MSSRSKRKQDLKANAVRLVSLVLAGVMILSVVLATVWRW